MKIRITLILCSLFLLTCTKETIKQNMLAEDLFEFSKEAFNKKKYNLAIEGFKMLVFEHPGSEFIDDGQFYLGESFFNSKDYENAVVEYRFFIQNFPESPYLDDANYKLGFSYYKSSPSYYLEQTRTEEALKIIERFLIRFPESEWIEEAEEVKRKCFDKLAKKELENAKLYYKLAHFRSAEIYLEDLLESYPSSIHIDETKYRLGLCYLKTEKKDEAIEIFQELSEEEGAFSDKAEKELEKLSKKERATIIE